MKPNVYENLVYILKKSKGLNNKDSKQYAPLQHQLSISRGILILDISGIPSGTRTLSPEQGFPEPHPGGSCEWRGRDTYVARLTFKNSWNIVP